MSIDPASVPPPVMTVRLAATVLSLEAFSAFFATVAAAALVPAQGRYTAAQVWLGGAVLVVVLVVVAGLVRRPGGLVLGWLAQGLLLATGVLFPAMWVVGALFALLWVWLLQVGGRIDADRRRWRAAR